MPELPVLKSRQVVSALEKAGFRAVRQRGSHLQMKRGNLLVTIPIHRGDVKRYVLRSILRQAQMTLEEFREYL
ncbi:MAG: type II toxin-antitoxin system HicA family toxin [Caldilineae bacterium]|nr:MAG: type II toxin-antitoxin system HicA family toxin [Caldilineae bacterium]